MKGATRYAIIAGVVIVLLVIGIILAAIFGVLLDVLYIFLMLLAALMVGATLLQVYSIVMLMRTISLVRNEMKPLLASVQDTIGIVKDTAQTAGHTVSTVGSTTQLASELAIGPSVHAVAAALAGQQMIRVFLGKGRTKSRAEQRRRSRWKRWRLREGVNNGVSRLRRQSHSGRLGPICGHHHLLLCVDLCGAGRRI